MKSSQGHNWPWGSIPLEVWAFRSTLIDPFSVAWQVGKIHGLRLASCDHFGASFSARLKKLLSSQSRSLVDKLAAIDIDLEDLHKLSLRMLMVVSNGQGVGFHFIPQLAKVIHGTPNQCWSDDVYCSSADNNILWRLPGRDPRIQDPFNKNDWSTATHRLTIQTGDGCWSWKLSMLFQLEDAGPAGSLFADALKVLKRRRSTLAALAVQLKTDLLGRQPLVCWFGMSNMTPISGSIRVHGIPCSESCGIQSGCRAKQRQEMPKRDLPSCDHRNIPSGKLNVWKITMFNPAWTTGGFIRPWARWASVVLARGGSAGTDPFPHCSGMEGLCLNSSKEFLRTRLGTIYHT